MMLTARVADALSRRGDRLLSSILRHLRSEAARAPVILFGAGEGGRALRRTLEAHRIPVSFFADNDERLWGTVVRGIPVLSPTNALRVPRAEIVISAGATAVIARQLKRAGTERIEERLYLMHQTLPFRRVWRRHLHELSKVHALLRDARSLRTFDTLLHQTFALDPRPLSTICDPNQYFWSRRFALRRGDTVVDGGAYTGDTLRDILCRFGRRFKAVHCFEPSRQSYATLQNFARRRCLATKVTLHHIGLSDRGGAAYFSGTGTGYHVAGVTDTLRERVALKRLDDLFLKRRVDFIKLDIEGAEPQAIRGAEQVIQRDRPRLAICVYHAPEHLWEIPLMLARMVPEYSFFLRHHSTGRYETVWYAAPRS